MNWKRQGSRFAVIAGLFAGLPLPASAQVDVGPYLAGSLGASLQNSRSTSTSTQGTAGSAASSSESAAHFGTGLAVSITPGFALGENFRTDLDLSYVRKPAKSAGIDEQAYAALANVWVDVLHQYGYFIYFGAGLGGADVHLHSSGGDSALAPVWQLGAGGGVTLTSNWALSADFRRVSAFEKSSFRLNQTENLKTRYGSNAVGIGLRYAFGGMSAPFFGGSTE